MLRVLRVLVPLACAAALYGQSQAPAQPAGMLAPWEMAPVLEEMAAHGGRLVAALDRVDARAWIDKGASETYLAQWQSSKEQAAALADGAKVLARNPEKLSAGLELLFRVQALDSMLTSLVEGMRKYQTVAAAQQLASLAGEIAPNRERFERYLVGLAAGQEQQLAVMDREAQRCRGIMTAPAASSSSRTGKKK